MISYYKAVKTFKTKGYTISEGDILKIEKNTITNITTHEELSNVKFEDIIGSTVYLSDNISEHIKNHPFEEITKQMFEIYIKKNKDYGNSFDQSLDKWGLSVAAIRLGDKLNRFESFVKNGSFSVNDESVRDTLSDLATYAVMTIMYLNNNK